MEHRVVDAEALRERCKEGSLTKLGQDGEGELRLQYFRHSSGDMLIRTSSFGEHLIADAGLLVLSSVEDAAPELWRRYVLGQVLPLTASIQGLEIFHASAVAVGGGVIAMAGPSGAGKSSLAAALIQRGAAFFTDDVLAIEAGAFKVTAFPGTALMSLPHDHRLLSSNGLVAGEPWLADERKSIVPVNGVRRALPIRAFLRLMRTEKVSEPVLEPCLPNSLMATTFDGVTRAPERLRRLLRVGAMLAADNRAMELCYGPDSDPDSVARALIGWLEAKS